MSETYEYEGTILKIRKGFMHDPEGVYNDLRKVIIDYISAMELDAAAGVIKIEWQPEIEFEMSGLERLAPCFKNTRAFWGKKQEAADDDFFWCIKNGEIITTGAVTVPDPKHWQKWD